MNTLKKKKVLTLNKDKEYSVVEVSQTQKNNGIRFISAGLATEVGYSIAIPIVAGAFLGVWLDDVFHSKPKLTLSLIFFGIFLSFVNLFRIVNSIIKKEKQ